MKENRESLMVHTPSKKYPIVIKGKVDGICSELIPEDAKVMAIVDEEVDKLYGDRISRLLDGLIRSTSSAENNKRVIRQVIPATEQSKSLKVAESLYSLAAEMTFDRSSWFVGIGGGVVGDLTGYVAATYMRGAHLLHIPTTLLAQTDSSVGGKVAINYGGYKNLVGTFYHPERVIAVTEFLTTLPKRELVSGLAEVIKYGILCDRALFFYVKDHLDQLLEPGPQSHGLYDWIVYRSCEIKADIVAQDELDKGTRMLLNLGHTFAHALEGATDYKFFKHGEAVLWGLLFAARLSYKKGYIEDVELRTIEALINELPVPPLPSCVKEEGVMLSQLLRDKKRMGLGVTVVLPTKIGEAKVYHNFSEDDLLAVVMYMFDFNE